MTAAVAAASWRWLEAQGPKMGTPGWGGWSPSQIWGRVLGVGPHLGEAACVGPLLAAGGGDNKTMWPCQQRRMR